MEIDKSLLEKLIIKLNGGNISSHVRCVRIFISAPYKNEDVLLVVPSIELDITAQPSELDELAPFSTSMYLRPIEVNNMIIELAHPLFSFKAKGNGMIEHTCTFNDKSANFTLGIDIAEVDKIEEGTKV